MMPMQSQILQTEPADQVAAPLEEPVEKIVAELGRRAKGAAVGLRNAATDAKNKALT